MRRISSGFVEFIGKCQNKYGEKLGISQGLVEFGERKVKQPEEDKRPFRLRSVLID